MLPLLPVWLLYSFPQVLGCMPCSGRLSHRGNRITILKASYYISTYLTEAFFIPEMTVYTYQGQLTATITEWASGRLESIMWA